MSFTLKSQQEVMQEIAERAKLKRLEQNLTQEGLALRSGVSLGSIKRFERSGEISLKSLIDIALALDVWKTFPPCLLTMRRAAACLKVKKRKNVSGGASNEIECFFECLRQAALCRDFRRTSTTYLF